MRRRGEITVFLSLTLVCILSLLMGLLESARTAGARLYLNMAANSAMASVMSQYNRNLWDMYHLLFLEYESEAAIKEAFESYLDFYLEQENFYPMKKSGVELEELVTMDENGGRALEDEILSYVRYRLPDIAADLAGISQNAGEAARAGDFRALFDVCRQAGQRTRRLERARASLEEALAEMEKLRKKGVDAAEREKRGRFEDNGEKLLKRMEQFPGLVDKYEEELSALSEHRELAAAGKGQENMDETAAGNMGLELAAYESVEQAAKEMLLRYRNMETELSESRDCLEEALGLLEDDEEGDDEAGEEEETDWSGILEYMEQVSIPEGVVSGTVDKEKSKALDRLEEVLSGDLLKLVVPEGTEISKKKVSLKGSLASRASKAGDWSGQDIQRGLEQLLVNEYIFLYFDSFLGKCSGREELKGQALSYEQEYLLCGKSADRENLAGTVEELLMVRGAMNLLYLLNSAEKKVQADELAMAVSGGNVPVQFILSFFILTLWAFGEALRDVRCLLEGGKIPFWKDDSTWKLDLSGLLSLELVNGRAESSLGGSDYEDYLRILFLLKNKELRNYRMMDVIQWNMRKKQSDFAAEDCAYEVGIQTKVLQHHVFLVKSEYEGTVKTTWSY